MRTSEWSILLNQLCVTHPIPGSHHHKDMDANSSDTQSLPPNRKFLNDHWIKRFTVFFVPLVVDLCLLVKLCGKIASQWRNIGVQLGATGHELDNIQANCRDPHMVENCLSRVFTWWLTRNQRDTDITPGKLAQAIHIVGEHEVEVEIKRTFGKYVPLILFCHKYKIRESRNCNVCAACFDLCIASYFRGLYRDIGHAHHSSPVPT